MPWPSKRKKQLQTARRAKRQKQQPGNSREERLGREPEGDVLDGEDRALEGELSDGGWDDPGPEGGMPDGEDPELEVHSVVNDRDAPETEGEAPDRDINELIKDYARDWVDGLDRDDLRSLSILLHYLLVCLLLLGDTVWDGKVQRMVFNVAVLKGLIQVLKERGRYRNGMKLDEMRAEISGHPDFKNEKTKIEHFLNGKGYGCVFLPKFHCELNPIEQCWGQAKRYTRSHCNYTIGGLRKNVPQGLDCVTVDNIRNYFRKSKHYIFGYLQGVAGGPDLEELVKKMEKYLQVASKSRS